MRAITVPQDLGLERARRWTDGAARALLFAAGIVLVGLLAAYAFGYRSLIVRSGSMEPAISTGDIVLTEVASPRDVALGDVITFRDPGRSGKLVTHRVVEMEAVGSRVAFVTQGDANGTGEYWTIDRDGRLGRVIGSVPGAGRVVGWATVPVVRFGLLVLGSSILAVTALRRIWAT